MQHNLKQQQKLSITQKIAIASGVSMLLIFGIIGFVKLTTVDTATAGSFCGVTIENEVVLSENTTCSEDLTIDGGLLYVDADLIINAKVEIKNGGQLIIRNLGSLKVSDIGVEDNDVLIEIQPGGWLFIDKGQIENCAFVNDGYVEHSSSTQLKFKKVDVEGDGVFFVPDDKKLKLEGNAKIFGKKNNEIIEGDFVLGSTVLNVKRLPKFKVQVDGLELGDSLRITDTLDLNGKNIDIKTYDFTLPKSFSFHREGQVAEYIKTGSTGRYKLKVLKNEIDHIAPIGRNPYLPVTINCEDCQGTEFGAAVTQNVYLDPIGLTGLQTTSAVGETWSLIPNRDITGDITIQLQWNNGEAGSTSSELSSFNRNSATPYYWVVGESNMWTNDGVHINVIATGTDPSYWVEITLNGMVANKEYLFSIGSNGTALPVEFTYVNAFAQEKRVEIAWGTATETNNDFFEVQRSQDGIKWETLEKLNGAGTTINPRDYISYDNTPLSGLSYYRIKQVDFDGTTDYSKVREVKFESSSVEKLAIEGVFPNPFTDKITIDCVIPNDGRVQVELIGQNGISAWREEMEVFAGKQQLSLDNLIGLNRGYYIILIKQDAYIVSKKVIKN